MPKGFTLVGRIGIDSGTLWIGDPCYVWSDSTRNEPTAAVREIGEWSDFAEKLEGPTTSFGIIGVATSTGLGDGMYDVYAKIVDGLVHEVRVVFLEEQR